MKKILVLLFIVLAAKFSSAQQGFRECIVNSIHSLRNMNPDSLVRLGIDPFEVWRSCVEGKPMPDFTAKTISGNTINMKELKDKVVVINFWFIDCHPCIVELPALNKLVEDYRDKNVVFLAITYETLKRLNEDFFPQYKFDFTIIPDAKTVTRMFNATGYPTTYIVDKKGIINTAWCGGSINEAAKTEAYLKAKPIIDELLKAE